MTKTILEHLADTYDDLPGPYLDKLKVGDVVIIKYGTGGYEICTINTLTEAGYLYRLPTLRLLKPALPSWATTYEAIEGLITDEDGIEVRATLVPERDRYTHERNSEYWFTTIPGSGRRYSYHYSKIREVRGYVLSDVVEN